MERCYVPSPEFPTPECSVRRCQYVSQVTITTNGNTGNESPILAHFFAGVSRPDERLAAQVASIMDHGTVPFSILELERQGERM